MNFCKAVYCLTTVLVMTGLGSSAFGLTPLGPGELNLSLGGGLLWDSNIYRRSTEVSDFIWMVSPKLNYVQDRGLIHMNASFGADYNGFLEEDQQSGTDWDFSFDLSGMHREPRPAFSFSLGGGWQEGSTASYEVGDRIERTSKSLNAGVDVDISDKTGINLNSSWSEQENDRQDLVGSESIRLRTNFFYRYSEKLSYNGGYSYSTIDHPGRDYGTNSYTIGASGTFSQKLSGNVNVGIMDREEAGSGLTYSLSLAWKMDDNTSFSLTGNRNDTPSLTGEAATSTSLRLGASQRLTQRMAASAYIGFTKFDRSQAELSRSDDSIDLGISISSQVSDNAQVAIVADYEDRSSDSDFSNYQRIQLSLVGSMQF